MTETLRGPAVHAQRARRLAVLVGIAACASPGLPPGGPEDRDPPELVSITPDTFATGVSPRAVVFRFDEVVSERPQGATTLAGLFLISPRDGAPDVDWNRTALTVRPRRGWRRNTAYTVTMLPGVVDLRGNVRREGGVAVFSTGGPIPRTMMAGQVFDWSAGAPAGRALVEAISRPDSVVHVAQADSTGAFRIRYAPPGTYTIRAFIDANNNRGFEERELWDSVQVVLKDSAHVELLAFAHDTIGPRITTVAIMDSMTLRVTFDKGIDPSQEITAASFSLRARDSSLVPIASARSAQEWDRARAARADSQPADTIRRAPPAAAAARPAVPTPTRPAARATPDSASVIPRPSRPSPRSEFVIELGRPLQPREVYRWQATDVRGLMRTPRTSDRTFTVPEPPAAQPARADTAAAAQPRPTTPSPRR